MIKKCLSTFEREMKHPHFKKAFEKRYKELLLSELLMALMEKDEKSVRGLKRSGLIADSNSKNPQKNKSLRRGFLSYGRNRRMSSY